MTQENTTDGFLPLEDLILELEQSDPDLVARARARQWVFTTAEGHPLQEGDLELEESASEGAIVRETS